MTGGNGSRTVKRSSSGKESYGCLGAADESVPHAFLAAVVISIAGSAGASLASAFLKGDAVLKTGGTRSVYVYVQSRGPRGNIDRAFWPASAEPIGGPALLDLRNASIEVTTNRVVIISAVERTVVVLALADGRDAKDEHFPPDYKLFHFRGYGLSHRFRTAETTLDDVAVPKSDDCPAGGIGATSCSCTSRSGGGSASCVSGYFACCSCPPRGTPTCQCVKQ